MLAEDKKQREWSDDLLHSAVSFHGHLGPFLVVGLRMGLAALRMLEASGWFDLRCSAKLSRSTPDSCVIDGIQFSTGCTMGKYNIEVEEGEGIAADFTKVDKKFSIVLRQEIFQEIRDIMDEKGEEQVIGLINGLVEASDTDLFEFNLGY